MRRAPHGTAPAGVSGEFEIAQARTLEQLEALAAEERLVDAFVPADQLLPAFPNVYVDDLTAAQVRHGRNFPASPFRAGPPARYVKAVTRTGEPGGDRRGGAAEFIPSDSGTIGLFTQRYVLPY